MKPAAGALLSLGVALAGCAHYDAAPVTIATLAPPRVQASDLPATADAHALLQLALAHDPAVAAARATLGAAIHAQNAAHNLPPLSLTLTAEYSKDADPQKPWLYGGSVGIPLDVGAKRRARVTGADLAVLKARYALGDAIWSVRQRLYAGLSELALSQREVALNQALLDERLAYQALTQKRVTHGEDAQALVSQAALDVSGARQALAQAQAKHIQAVANLALALDCTPATAHGLAPVALPALDTLDAGGIERMVMAGLYNRSDILSAIVDYDIAENELRAAIAAQYPDINLQPGYTWERGQVKIPFSLSLTLPPLDDNRAAISAAQSTRLAAGKTLEATVKTTRAAAVQAAATYGADLATMRTIGDKDVPAANDMAARVERMKNAGESDADEALLSRLAATQTALNFLLAERTARTDRLTLEDAARQSLDPIDMQILTQAMTAEAPK